MQRRASGVIDVQVIWASHTTCTTQQKATGAFEIAGPGVGRQDNAGDFSFHDTVVIKELMNSLIHLNLIVDKYPLCFHFFYHA